MKEKINVLIVDDSSVAREMLVHILSSDPQIHVIGTAVNGEETLESIKKFFPDVITMDIHMPKMDGYEATRRIMETTPVPIIIVTASTSFKEVSIAMRAIEAGAVAIAKKPAGIGHVQHLADASMLIKTVKLMSEVKVVKRRNIHRRETFRTDQLKLKRPEGIRIVAIGASTGGPPVLQTILSNLPVNFPVPVLIVQHMAPGFLDSFGEWLSETSSLSVHIASQYERILPGHAYLAPDGFQMKIADINRIMLTKDEPENGLRPSVSYLFRHVANEFGKNAVGILLTGMGKDGAEELKMMKDKGAITIAQNKESCAVYGMPFEAMSLNAATYVTSPEDIAKVLSDLVYIK